MNAINIYGLDDGQKIDLLIKQFIINKNYNENITLAELYNLTKIKIIMTTVCVNNKKIEYLSYDTFPTLQLWKAIRMSVSIPWIYSPVVHEGKYYIDGGVMDNYPIKLFKNNKENVIGVFLENTNDDISINNVETYTLRILQCFIEGNNDALKHNYETNTISVFFDNVSVLQYDISLETKIDVYNKGYNAAKTYISSISST